MEKIEVTLPDNTKIEGHKFYESDGFIFANLCKDCFNTNILLKSYGGRSVNLQDVVTEGLFCVLFPDCIRTNSTKNSKSYDCVNIKTGKGIQIKSSTIQYDCSSFGPKSTWDELYYMDFAPEGSQNGRLDIYKIENDFSNLVLNKKGETFADQQKAGRRPRFSIKKDIIEKNNLKPILCVNLFSEKPFTDIRTTN